MTTEGSQDTKKSQSDLFSASKTGSSRTIQNLAARQPQKNTGYFLGHQKINFLDGAQPTLVVLGMKALF